jgi:hypothetical protein
VAEANFDYDEALTLSRLRAALAPLGIELAPHLRVRNAHVLSITANKTARSVGIAVVVYSKADLHLRDTVWIGLPPKGLSIAIQKYTSVERIFEVVNARLVRALRPKALSVRRAGAGKHRDILCPNREAEHGFTVTVHTQVGQTASRRWRCDECHYDIVLP